MHRLYLALLGIAPHALARSPGFSPQDDVLAQPQFEVIFSDSIISEHDADLLLRHNANPALSPDPVTSSEVSDHVRPASSSFDEDRNDRAVDASVEYHLMTIPPSKYLCSIPVIESPEAENQTLSDLAKAEEAKELARATDRGWELLKDLNNGDCMFFMSGWWSYRFCYNRETIQFHALPQIQPGMAPQQDPHTAAYILGRVPKQPSRSKSSSGKKQLRGGGGGGEGAADDDDDDEQSARPANTELQVKGDQRYLIQRMDSGTICDLTGRERTIEVQYHCAPGMKSDKIGWIKEVTTCAYLMVVNTPRLCADVAFLPPKETAANEIVCRLVLPSTAEGQGTQPQIVDVEASAAAAATAANPNDPTQDTSPNRGMGILENPITIGGVVVGGRNVLRAGDSERGTPLKLEPPRLFAPPLGRGGDARVEVIASRKSKAEGGALEELSPEELEKRDLQASLVDEMKKELEQLAGDKGWRLEVVEGEQREIRGLVDTEAEGDDLEADRLLRDSGGNDERRDGEEEDGEQGSEETMFKDEL